MLGKIRQYEWGQKKEGLDNQIRSSDNMAGNKRSIQFSTTQATEKKKTVLKDEFKNGIQDEQGEIKNREIRQEVRRA